MGIVQKMTSGLKMDADKTLSPKQEGDVDAESRRAEALRRNESIQDKATRLLGRIHSVMAKIEKQLVTSPSSHSASKLMQDYSDLKARAENLQSSLTRRMAAVSDGHAEDHHDEPHDAHHDDMHLGADVHHGGVELEHIYHDTLQAMHKFDRYLQREGGRDAASVPFTASNVRLGGHSRPTQQEKNPALLIALNDGVGQTALAS